MIFSQLIDSHDRRVEAILLRAKENDQDVDEAELTNFNLIGIRRRLNNIEVGVWVIAALLAIDLYMRW